MFGHPVRDTFDLVTPNCRFLKNDSYCDVVTRCGQFSKIVRDMRIAVIIKRPGHRKMRFVPSAAESFLVKSGCAISKTCKKKNGKRSFSPYHLL